MRKRRAEKRNVLPDPVYNSKVITKLVNSVMQDGKKGTAEKIVYDAFEIIEKITNEKAIDVYQKCMVNITPALEVKSRRVGGSNVQVPIEVNSVRGQTLALRYLMQHAKKRSGKGLADKLAHEIIDAAAGTGGAAKKREDVHKMAESNKAFAHFKW